MHWYALRVQSGKDFKVAEKLVSAGFQAVCFFKIQKTRHRRNKSVLTKRLPVFSGYVFVRFHLRDYTTVMNRVFGVLGILRNRATMNPEPIQDETIEVLRIAQNESVFDDRTPVKTLKVGDRVSFDFFGKTLEAAVSKILGGLVTIKSEMSGKCVTITRSSNEFGALGA